jgi:hypothetical protein
VRGRDPARGRVDSPWGNGRCSGGEWRGQPGGEVSGWGSWLREVPSRGGVRRGPGRGPG